MMSGTFCHRIKKPWGFVPLLVLFAFSPVLVRSQETTMQDEVLERGDRMRLGLGFGQEFGGIGAQLNVRSLRDNAAFFAGLGYAFAGPGLTTGAQWRILPQRSFCPTITAMFGNVAAIRVDGAVKGTTYFSKVYFGPSVGVGLDVALNRSSNFFRLAVFRSVVPEEYFSDVDRLKKDPSVRLPSDTDPPPVTISLGYFFTL